MTKHHLHRFLTSATARLAGTYLAIIMLMSIGFSVVFYNTSSQQLGRQLPPDSLYHGGVQAGQQGNPGTGASGVTSGTNSGPSTVTVNDFDDSQQVHKYIQARIDEGRHALLERLVYLNVSALLLGSLISYALARRSLEPIEQSMEAQAQFVSDASHELRTPLTAIQTSNEVFLRRSKPTIADAQKLIEQNTEDVKRLKVLSDGLLNLAQHKQSATPVGPVSLQQVVSEAVTQIVPQASQKSIAVTDEVANVSVLGDKSTLTQALIILLDNAIKYSGPDTTVSLSSRIKGKNLYLDVQDQGIGIRASDMPHLFRRFYRADTSRTHGAQHGYGLGLAIAKQIMTNQHGDIEVTSEPDKGSTFSLKLPLAPEVPKRPS